MDRHKAGRYNPDQIPKLDEYESASLYFRRLVDHMHDGHISKSTVAFELLASLFGSSESEKHTPEDFIEALPVEDWRTNRWCQTKANQSLNSKHRCDQLAQSCRHSTSAAVLFSLKFCLL